MLPTLAVDWRASAVRGEEAGRFREVAGISIVAAGSPRSAVDTLNCRQPSKECFDTGLNLGQEYQKGKVEEMQYVAGT